MAKAVRITLCNIGGLIMEEDNITYLEMARIAMATMPEDLAEGMDISDDELIRLRDQLHIYLDWEVKE